MKFKRGLLNIFFGLSSQLIILALGIVIPRLFIVNYGSEVNGLFSTISQIFAYVALLEAGVGTATVQALYRPITKKDHNDISGILSATQKYYKRVSLYYIICVVVLAIVYPLLVDSSISKVTIGIILLLQGLSGVINFYFQATLKQLVIAEGRSYVISNIALVVNVCTSIIKITLIYLGADIVYIQFAFFVISILQILLYNLYFRKKYRWVNLKVAPNFDALTQKNSFFIHQISGLIFSSTDVLLLSIFCDFKVVSIYAIYNLVMTSLNTLASTLNNSLLFVLSLTYHEDKKKYANLHDAYNTYYITFIFSLMSVCYMLFLPFIDIYTRGADLMYVDSYLPFLFCLIQILSCTRMVSSNLINIAGHIKQTVSHSIFEACINIVVSVALVKSLGIYGVLIGTTVALLYRTSDIIIYSEKMILHRSPLNTFKPIIINALLFISVVLINRKLDLVFNSYIECIKWGISITIIIMPIYFIVNSVLARKEFIYLIGIIKPHVEALSLKTKTMKKNKMENKYNPE